MSINKRGEEQTKKPPPPAHTLGYSEHLHEKSGLENNITVKITFMYLRNTRFDNQ